MQTTQINSVRPADLTTPTSGAKAPKPAQALYLPDLQPGDRYAGVELDTEGNPTAHLILLAARPTSKLNHQAAMEWAASVGGALPTTQEQSLLFANCKAHLPSTWCWSCETCDGDASYAWICHFFNGSLDSSRKSYEGSAVAVRRSVIQSFNPLNSAAQ